MHFVDASRVRSTGGIYFLVSPATVVTERFTRTDFLLSLPLWTLGLVLSVRRDER